MRAIQVLSVLATLGFIAFCTQLLLDARTDAQVQARRSDAGLTELISQDVSRSFEIFDLALQGVIKALQEPGLMEASPAVRRLALFDRTAEARHVNHIVVLDALGRIVEDSRATAHGPLSFADRDYFRVHQTTPDYGLYVSKPLQSRLDDNEWILALSRRISGPNGEFQGVALATLSLDYFQGLFANLQSNPSDIFAILRTDGSMIMRHPFRARQVGEDFSSSPAIQALPDEPRGVFAAKSRVDQTFRTYTYQRVANLPLLVVVGASQTQVMQAWFHKAASMAAMMTLLMATMAMLGVLLVRELRQRRKAEKHSAELVKLLAVQAGTDTLTGLPNRRQFEDVSAKEWRRAIRDQRPLSVLVVDVDHFKLFNDRHGHLHGDETLKEVAISVRGALRRASDLCARFGGEEFTVLLPGTDLPGGCIVAEQIRQSVVRRRFDDPDGTCSALTVSIGVASAAPRIGDSFASLLAQADLALYKAKANGRNRVEAFVAETPGAGGENALSTGDQES